MEEILHQLIGSLSHNLHGFIHPRWCRISSINSMASSHWRWIRLVRCHSNLVELSQLESRVGWPDGLKRWKPHGGFASKNWILVGMILVWLNFFDLCVYFSRWRELQFFCWLMTSVLCLFSCPCLFVWQKPVWMPGWTPVECPWRWKEL